MIEPSLKAVCFSFLPIPYAPRVGVGVVDDDDDDDVLAAYFEVTSSRNRRTWGDVILDGGKCKRPEEQG
jgi:hypothetical protein